MHFDRPNRPIALKNLEIAFPEMTPGRGSTSCAGCIAVGAACSPNGPICPSSAAPISSESPLYEGKENWDEAERRSNGRGLFVLTAHFGNFELMQIAHSIYGYRLAIVHRALRNPLIDAAICTQRVRYGNQIIERKAGGREMMRMLRQNWMIAIALDLDVRKGVFVDFFGLPASTSDGIARISIASGAPVMPVFMVRDGDTIHHKMKIMPAFYPEKRARSRGRRARVHAAYTDALETADPRASRSLELDPPPLENPPARRTALLLIFPRRIAIRRYPWRIMCRSSAVISHHMCAKCSWCWT